MTALLLLFLAAPARCAVAPVQAFIADVSALVAQEQGRPADEVSRLDRRIETLSSRAGSLGYTAAPALAAAAEDAAKPEKLRLWMVASLESLHDPAAFAPFSRLALDRSAPDSVREAALRGAAGAPVSARARRVLLCSALAAAPGPQACDEALFELRVLGCDDPAPLERRAGPDDAHADWAIAALGASPSPAALESLYRAFRRQPRGSPARLAVLRALLARAPELAVANERWWRRACAMAEAEKKSPASAAAALRLIAALGDPAAARVVARFLRSRDGGVVVAAAETLASLRAEKYAADVRKVYDGYLQDPRFAAGPGRDPVGWYDRLGAAAARLSSARP